MFNSLNTLSYLITSDSVKASAFTENLAEVYRYILSQWDHSLVLLEDELAFTYQYTNLLHLRFGNALIIKKHFNGSLEKGYLIPPTSVFVAFENAVKHNEISETMPLYIDMNVSAGTLVIVNRIQERPKRNPSPQIGLRNLDERFKIVTGTGISAVRENNTFVVRLPLVPMTA